jgi:hypothetical protein
LTHIGDGEDAAPFSRDGRTLYVPVYGPANIGRPGPDEHTLHFLRTSDCQIEAPVRATSGWP